MLDVRLAKKPLFRTNMRVGSAEQPGPEEPLSGAYDVTFGYGDWGLGNLNLRTFDFDGDTYTVRALYRTVRDFRDDGFEFPGLGYLEFYDHGNDGVGELVLWIGDERFPFDEAATSGVRTLGDGRRVRHFGWWGFPEFTSSFTSSFRVVHLATEVDRAAVEMRGPDGLAVSARLSPVSASAAAGGGGWVAQTYPTACFRADPALVTTQNPWGFPGCVDAASQWFVVRLDDNRRYTVEVDTAAHNRRPRLNHVAPTWATAYRIGSLGAGSSTIAVETGAGAAILRGGDYLVRVNDPNGIAEPAYRIRIRELD